MGDALYHQVIEDQKISVCVYAPVGPYQDLLPYLVRRMLENGANSSFVNQIYNKKYKPKEIAIDPVQKARGNEQKSHPKIALPKNLYGGVRENSSGIDFDDPVSIQKLLGEIEQNFKPKNYQACPVIAGKKIIKRGGLSKI